MTTPLQILTADVIPIQRLLSGADIRQRTLGQSLFQSGAVSIISAEQSSAWLRVTEKSGQASVHIQYNGYQLTMGCSCRNRYAYTMCEHRIAAAMALQKHLTDNPPTIWRAAINQLTAVEGRAPSASQARIVFSLQMRQNHYAIVPYTLAGRHLAISGIADNDALATALETSPLDELAKPLRQRIARSTYPAVSSETVAAANLAVGSMTAYNYGYYGAPDTGNIDAVLSLLSDGLLYLGDEKQPLQRRLRVFQDAASLEMEIARTESGSLHLTPHLTRADGVTLPFADVDIVLNQPLWLIAGDSIVPIAEHANTARTLLGIGEVTVPPRDEAEFLDRYLLPLANRLPLRGDTISWEDVELPPDPRMYLSEQSGTLRAELRFGYGDFELPYIKNGPPATVQRIKDTTRLARIIRDQDAEDAVHETIGAGYGLKRGSSPELFALRANTKPVDFLLHSVPKMAQDGLTIFGEETLSSSRVNRSRPTIQYNVSSGIDWFDVKADVMFGDVAADLKDLRRAVRKREKYVKLADGSLGAIPEDWANQHRHLLGMAEEQKDGTLRLNRGHIALIEAAIDDETVKTQLDKEYRERRERLRTFAGVVQHDVPPTFIGTLRDYQKEGFDWLHFLYDYGFGGCLAFDMGLGKTPVTLAFIESLYHGSPEKKATLVVMPRSLLFNWEREAEKFTPELSIYIHADQGRANEIEEFDRHDVVLTTYGTMLRDIELLRQYRFDMVVLDESQAIKNPIGETSRAVRLLQTDHRLALTGTPVENGTLELWSQFAFLNPGLLGSIEYFRSEFVNPIERGQDADVAATLRRLVRPFILRRTKGEVALDLPPRTERVLETEMERTQQAYYTKQRDYYRSLILGLIEEEGVDNARMKILEGLLRLRQAANHPRLSDPKYKGGSAKFELLFETIETLREEGHKALIFSQFVQMLTIIREELDKRGIPYAYLDGSTRNRQGEVDRFQNDPALPFFLISLKAGGVGLNLTAADYVIHVDPWWNPAVEQQATDRTHRIGQDKPVFVYRLVVRNTVEEKILALQDQKRALVEQLIESEGGVFRSLSRDDIEALFS